MKKAVFLFRHWPKQEKPFLYLRLVFFFFTPKMVFFCVFFSMTCGVHHSDASFSTTSSTGRPPANDATPSTTSIRNSPPSARTSPPSFLVSSPCTSSPSSTREACAVLRPWVGTGTFWRSRMLFGRASVPGMDGICRMRRETRSTVRGRDTISPACGRLISVLLTNKWVGSPT